MGILAMELGPVGTGKTTGLLSFANGEVEIFGVTGKRLPFRTQLAYHPNASYRMIYDALVANRSKAYVIDDSTYLMQFDAFRHAKERGYDKFVTMALSFQTLLDAAAKTDPITPR